MKTINYKGEQVQIDEQGYICIPEKDWAEGRQCIAKLLREFQLLCKQHRCKPTLDNLKKSTFYKEDMSGFELFLTPEERIKFGVAFVGDDAIVPAKAIRTAYYKPGKPKLYLTGAISNPADRVPVQEHYEVDYDVMGLWPDQPVKRTSKPAVAVGTITLKRGGTRTLYRGARGGLYYLTASGRKCYQRQFAKSAVITLDNQE